MYQREQTQSGIIWKHYQRAVHSPLAKKNAIGYAACQAYVDATPAEARTLKIAIGNDAATEAANGQMVYRMLNPDETQPAQQLRADFAPFVVNALPEPMRTDCIRELMEAAYGVMPMPRPEAGEPGNYRGMGCVMRETGEFIHVGASAPQNEAERLVQIKEGKEAAAAIMSQVERLEAMQEQPLRAVK